MTSDADACVVCALIFDGSAAGRDELWRDDVTISYVCAVADSVDQVAVAPLRHASTPTELSEAEFAAVLLAARDVGVALTRVLEHGRLFFEEIDNGTRLRLIASTHASAAVRERLATAIEALPGLG